MTTRKTPPRLQFAIPSKYKQLPIISPHYVEPMLDGVRGILVFRGEVGTAYSITGRAMVNAWPIIKELEMSELVENLVLDGEFVNTFNADGCLALARSTDLPDSFGINFHAYDIMALGQWEEKICEMPLHYRKSILAELLLKGAYRRTLFTPAKYCSDYSSMKAEQQCFKRLGYDGAVYKDVEAPYPFSNTLDWLLEKA